MKTIVLLALAFLAAQPTMAEPNKKAMAVLTYDDALNVHLDTVIPELNNYGLRGTFYITVDSAGFSQRIEEWRKAAALGHELGNHTLYHPCDGSLPGREWVLPSKDLSKWTLEQFIANIRVTNTILEAVDGKKERTFAYTCGDTSVGKNSVIPAIKTMFPAARGVDHGLEDKSNFDLYNIRAIGGNGQDGKTLIKEVDKAIEQGKLIVFLFHGVGGEHDLNVPKEAHSKLIQYLAQQHKNIGVTTLIELTKHPQL